MIVTSSNTKVMPVKALIAMLTQHRHSHTKFAAHLVLHGVELRLGDAKISLSLAPQDLVRRFVNC